MSCILRITGENFDVDNYILKSKIVPYRSFHKGSPIYESKPEGEKSAYSGCSIEISKAEFNDFKQQVVDATNYLNEHHKELQFINNTEGIQFATLDFGVDYEQNKFVQSHYLPPVLLRVVADLGISIEFSVYQPTE